MISVLIRNEEQYQIIKNYNLDCIYTDNLKLAKKYDLYYETPRVYEKLDNLPDKLLINDTGLLTSKNKKIVTNYSLNVANSKTIALLLKYHVQKITLSVELTLEELRFLNTKNKPLEIIIYGKIVNMFLKSHLLINDNDFKLINSNHKYPLRIDDNNHVSVFHYEPINLLDKILEYQKLGIKYFRLDFLDEKGEDIKKILDKIQKQIS